MIMEIHEVAKTIQKELEKAGKTDVAEALACACLNLRVAHERWIGEGKTGDQTSSRQYSGPSNSRGLETPKTKSQKNLLDPENSRAAKSQRQQKSIWRDALDNMPF